MVSVDAYNTLFRDALYKYTDISKSEAMKKYIIGLREDTHFYEKESLPAISENAILLA